MDRRVKFLQSAAKSVSPPRLLSQSSAWGESSEPCRTSSTDRRVVALPHPRWQGTTERFAPLISRWCRPPVVTLPNPQPGSRARGARRGGQNPRSGHGWNIATTHLDLLRPNLRVAPAGITSSLACLNWSVALEPALSLFVGSTAKAVATDLIIRAACAPMILSEHLSVAGNLDVANTSCECFRAPHLQAATAHQVGPLEVKNDCTLSHAQFDARVHVEVCARDLNLDGTRLKEGGRITVKRARVRLNQLSTGAPSAYSGWPTILPSRVS